MKISTKGRYALRLMLDLATYAKERPVSLKDVANRQDISEKYLEQIMSTLNKAGYVRSIRGAQGGYLLTKLPEEYTVGMILRLTEGDLAPVACLECGAKPCDRAFECRTYPIWTEFYRIVNEYFDGITLADILKIDTSDNYSI